MNVKIDLSTAHRRTKQDFELAEVRVGSRFPQVALQRKWVRNTKIVDITLFAVNLFVGARYDSFQRFGLWTPVTGGRLATACGICQAVRCIVGTAHLALRIQISTRPAYLTFLQRIRSAAASIEYQYPSTVAGTAIQSSILHHMATSRSSYSTSPESRG